MILPLSLQTDTDPSILTDMWTQIHRGKRGYILSVNMEINGSSTGWLPLYNFGLDVDGALQFALVGVPRLDEYFVLVATRWYNPNFLYRFVQGKLHFKFDYKMKKEPRCLHLVLKHQWYDMIDDGLKIEEYRSHTPRYRCLLENRSYDYVVLHRGYTKTVMTFMYDGYFEGTGRPEWGAAPGVTYFVIRLFRRIVE